MLEYPSVKSEYCARCSKCLDNEPVSIRCEICDSKICNDCRAIDTRKRTIIATSLTKGGGSKPHHSGRLLNMIGSKLSVLSAFRSGLSKDSFEFDELDEEEQLYEAKKAPSSSQSNREQNEQFDKYFDQYSDKNQLKTKEKDKSKHNKIEKQLSFQYASERRRRLSTSKLNEGGGSLDIENVLKVSSNLLAIPIDQQKQASHSDSQLNRTNSIELQKQKSKQVIKTNSFDHFDHFDSNNNLNENAERTRLKITHQHSQLNRMVSLDERTSATQINRKSPLHTPLERSNTVDHCDNVHKTNDFILSICILCAKQM